jgi:hypothetical protein
MSTTGASAAIERVGCAQSLAFEHGFGKRTIGIVAQHLSRERRDN